MRISEHKIEEVRNSVNIVDIISEFIQLRKRGRNYLGLCPFHKEKTPSFTVSEDKQIYHCFGCNNGGNVFKFLMEYKSISFVEAVQELAERMGISLDFEEALSEKQSEQEILYDINAEVVRFYLNNLLGELEGEYARSYFENRKIKIQTIRAFGLGFALNSRDSLLNFLISKKIDLDRALHLGLIGKSDNGKLYDKLSGRIIFPIFSPNGRVVAFAGRTLVDKPDFAKYINSPESSIYLKGRVLYGLSHSKDEIRRSNKVIIVEGYMDLISLYQNGIKNVVAVSGTALTDEQALILSRYTKNVVLLFDADTAGINASLRSIEILLKRDFDIKISTLPAGEDPDTFVNKFGMEEFKEVIKRAHNFLEFQTEYYEKQGAFNDPQKTTETIRALIKPVSLIEDELKRHVLIKNISKKFNLREKLLEKELENALKSKVTFDQKPSVKKDPEISNESLFDKIVKKKSSTLYFNKEVELIKFLFEGNEKILTLIFKNVDPDSLDLEIHKNIFYKILDDYEQYKIVSPSHLISIFDNEIQDYLRKITIEQHSISERWKETHPSVSLEQISYEWVKDLIIKIKQLQIDEQINENLRIIESTENEELRISLMKLNSELSLNKLNVQLIEE
jgi:DNA primase